jgi:hypothetical protein
MSVRLGIDGSLVLKDGDCVFVGNKTGGELPRIKRLHMAMKFLVGPHGSCVLALELFVKRDASHRTPGDRLATRYRKGQAGRGEEWVFPAELLLIDDTRSGHISVVGKWVLPKTQIVRVEPTQDGQADEDVVFHCYEFHYIDVAGGNQLLSSDSRVVPLKAPWTRP